MSEELHIPIDCIAGTSMGSVIGGLYAAGMTTNGLEQAIEDIDWGGVFSDEPDRTHRTLRRKSDDQLFLVKKKARVKEGEVNIAAALIQGQKFNLVLSELTLAVHGIHDFDQLEIPFRAVATDITNGQQEEDGPKHQTTSVPPPPQPRGSHFYPPLPTTRVKPIYDATPAYL